MCQAFVNMTIIISSDHDSSISDDHDANIVPPTQEQEEETKVAIPSEETHTTN